MLLNEEFIKVYENLSNLNEWVDSQGNKITSNSQTSIKSPSSNYEKRLEKLYNYIKINKSSQIKIDKIELYSLEDNGMSFNVYNNAGDKMNFQIKLLSKMDYWGIYIYKEKGYKRDLYDTHEGKGWENLLSAINQYFNIPVRNTPEYNNLLTEWVDKDGNKVNNQNTLTQATTQTAQPPVKIKKRKQVKNKFGILVDDWSKEFIKLGQHIWDVHGKPVDEQDSRVGPSLFRIYFDMPSGEEWRLEVTTTKVDSSKGLKMLEYWDYVLSTYRNGSEVIISRGHVQDYNALLDILLNQGVITNKSKCN